MSPCLPAGVPIEAVLVSNIRKCIPKTWKQSVSHLVGLTNTRSLNPYESGAESDSSKHREASLLHSLLNSVMDCACKGLLFEAFRDFSLVQHLVLSSSSSSLSCSQRRNLIALTISSLLEACATDYRFLSQGLQLHAYVISFGVHRHPLLLRRLVTFYSEFNLFFQAHVILESSRTSNPLPWNVLISAYVRNGLCKDALSLYRLMLSLGVKPDKFTYPTVIKACGEELNLELGRDIHRSVDACTRQWNLFAQNALISMYGKFGEVEIALRLFYDLPVRDAVSWNSIVSVCALMGKWDEALMLLQRMLEEFRDVSIITWNTVAGGFLRNGNSLMALEYLYKMRASALHLDPISVIISLKACTQLQAHRIGKEVHAASLRSGFNEYGNVQNALIAMYSSCEDLKHAITVFQQVDDKSIVTWNSMISGYSHLNRLDEASFLFREMLLSGTKPNGVTIASLLPLVIQMTNLQYGKEFHCYITKHEELKDCLLTSNALIGMYSKSGKITQAKKIFDSLNERDRITYTSLISGYGSRGQGEIALKLFEEMVQCNIKPDDVSMVAVLKACSHSGLITEGQKLFQKMTSEHGIEPTLEHYACLIDLFGRAGLQRKAQDVFQEMIQSNIKPDEVSIVAALKACSHSGLVAEGQMLFQKMTSEYGINPTLVHYACMADLFGRVGLLREAREIIRMMPYEPTPEIYSAFLGACQTFKDIELEKWAAMKLLEIRPEKSGFYLNMYGSEETMFESVKSFAGDLGVTKDPGYASVYVGGIFQSISAVDASSEVLDKTYCLLEKLASQMKDSGSLGS